MHYRELSTPSLTIDLDVMEHNLDRMAQSCREQGVGLRPHTKTHKTPQVARLQMERGAVGLTVAKVGEAEVMAQAGLDEILVAYPIFGREKLERLARLACEREILISLDNERTAQELSRASRAQGTTVGVLVEFDVGYRRCGLRPGAECVELARKIEKLPGLEFRGLMTYFGNVWGTVEERRSEAVEVAKHVACALEAFAQARVEVAIVSGGSTPSMPSLRHVASRLAGPSSVSSGVPASSPAVRALRCVPPTGHPAAEAAASTTASSPAARRTEFAVTVNPDLPRRMVPRLVSRPGWIWPAYSISSGELRVQKRSGSDWRKAW